MKRPGCSHGEPVSHEEPNSYNRKSFYSRLCHHQNSPHTHHRPQHDALRLHPQHLRDTPPPVFHNTGTRIVRTFVVSKMLPCRETPGVDGGGGEADAGPSPSPFPVAFPLEPPSCPPGLNPGSLPCSPGPNPGAPPCAGNGGKGALAPAPVSPPLPPLPPEPPSVNPSPRLAPPGTPGGPPAH